MKFRLNQYASDFYGYKDYTIAQGILSGKGQLVVMNNHSTKWKNQYFYREGTLLPLYMRVNGQEAKKFAKENGIIIGKE